MSASAMQFERATHLSVVALSAQGARDFFGTDFFKVVSAGQADPRRYKFGARIWLCFKTATDWNEYLRSGRRR